MLLALVAAAPAGDYTADAPGVLHRIDATGLPAPYETSSASQGPGIAARPLGALPRVPDGFEVSLLATGLEEPRTLRTAPNGDVFLAESGAGQIRVLRGSLPPSLFATGLTRPFGIAFWPPGPAPRYVYVAETNRVVRFPYTPGLLRASGPCAGRRAGTADRRALDPRRRVQPGRIQDVRLGRVRQQRVRSWRGWPGRGPRLRSRRAMAARRSRPASATASGLAVQPGGAVWCSTNERDGLGDDVPPDYVTSVRPGGFYGWPWFYIGNHPDPRHRGKHAELAGQVTVPDVLIQPHSAPLSMTFYPADGPWADMRGDAFVALHGSWNRATRTGYKVIRIRMQNGAPVGGYEDFLTGFVANADSVWGRPVGVAITGDALLVSEDGNGTVWRVTRRVIKP